MWRFVRRRTPAGLAAVGGGGGGAAELLPEAPSGGRSDSGEGLDATTARLAGTRADSEGQLMGEGVAFAAAARRRRSAAAASLLLVAACSSAAACSAAACAVAASSA